MNNIMEEVNQLLGISDSYKVPDKILEILLQNDYTSQQMYYSFMELFQYDLSYDWFFDYFQDEHADRKNKKQDFTPPCINILMSKLCGNDKGVVYEPTAGTGGIIIKDWDRRRKKELPWAFNPMAVWYIAEELSEKTIPFLLFNLSIRGINANVVHCNSLTRETLAMYAVLNKNNDPMSFSSVYRLPNNDKYANLFKVRFIKGT